MLVAPGLARWVPGRHAAQQLKTTADPRPTHSLVTGGLPVVRADTFAGVGWLLGPLKKARELCSLSKHLCSRTTHAALQQLPNPENASAWACKVHRWKLQPTAAAQTLGCHELAF